MYTCIHVYMYFEGVWVTAVLMTRACKEVRDATSDPHLALMIRMIRMIRKSHRYCQELHGGKFAKIHVRKTDW